MAHNLTSFGNLLGSLPIVSGKTFWVAPSDDYTVNGRACRASDGNDGGTPYRALRTINYAWTQCTAAAGDLIVLLPGTHTPQNSAGTQTSIAANISMVTMMGLPAGGSRGAGSKMPLIGARRRTIVSASTLGDELMNITAADVEVCYLTFQVATAIADPGQQGIDVSAGGTRAHIHDNVFLMTAGTTDTAQIGVEIIGAGANMVISNNYFLLTNNTGPAVRVTSTPVSCFIEHNTIEWSRSVTALDDMIEVAGVAVGLVIRDNDFISNNTTDVVDAIDIAGATGDESVILIRNVFPVGSDPVEPANVADVSFAGNILSEVSGGTGGTAVVT